MTAALTPRGDWRPVREAIESAYKKMGETVPSNIPTRDWNLSVLVGEALAERAKFKCIECKCVLESGHEIRCLDCKATLCEHCAPHHFWPNGRQAGGAHS